MKTFVISDIHGAYKAFLQCLEKAAFDKEQDRLICLGDVCDRGEKVKECIDELLTIKNLVYILGNHDAWTLDWAINGNPVKEWMEQGGAETAFSYKGIGMPKDHIRLLAKAPLWFIENNRLFLHAGFDTDRGVKETPNEMLFWDRALVIAARGLHRTCPEWKFGGYEEIFVGHTPTTIYCKKTPIRFCNVWMIDTGAGFGEYLTIMDIDTKEFWQVK
ncbi:MAG: metallophosphoesterase [Candidatus Omnitrophica bacterium]|nr:metallophosphoesterase [Candidatus Omnitrophota bacterium]